MEDYKDELAPIEFENKLHWYNTQKRWTKKKEFWRAVVYALTRPDDYKPLLLEKALKEQEYAHAVLQDLEQYGKENGFIGKNKNN